MPDTGKTWGHFLAFFLALISLSRRQHLAQRLILTRAVDEMMVPQWHLIIIPSHMDFVRSHQASSGNLLRLQRDLFPNPQCEF